ncbi:MAG TPA: DUF1080 domain-containing protein [Polyangiaceae bacterium]|nr:DUF1080 domain-containing protein [Polyangiaceae bacterium]
MRLALISMMCGSLVVACSDGASPENVTDGSAGANTGAAGVGANQAAGGGAGSSPVAPGGAGLGSGAVAGMGGSAGGGPVAGGGGEASSGATGVGGGDAGGGSTSGAGGASSGAGAGGAAAQTKLFDGATLDGWTEYPAGNWKVVDGALKATGKSRGFIATNADYMHYRLLFSVKPGGTGGHAPCVLQFCAHPPPTLDACGGIQFQPPKGGTWDYRPGHNNAGDGLFMHVGNPGPAEADGFYRCEVVANSATGEAKMACGGKDVVHFKDATAGKKGPWAIQTHNAGISDEYKDISVEEGITSDEYVTVKP